MSKISLSPDDIDEMRDILSLVVGGLKAIASNEELRAGEVQVGESFANIVFPYPEIHPLPEAPTPEQRKAHSELSLKGSQIEKELKDYTYELLTKGSPLFQQPVERTLGLLTVPFRMVPFDPFGAERVIKKVNSLKLRVKQEKALA